MFVSYIASKKSFCVHISRGFVCLFSSPLNCVRFQTEAVPSDYFAFLVVFACASPVDDLFASIFKSPSFPMYMLRETYITCRGPFCLRHPSGCCLRLAGHGRIGNELAPKKVRRLEGKVVSEVECGRMFSVAVVGGPEPEVFSWGCNDDGSTGHGQGQ